MAFGRIPAPTKTGDLEKDLTSAGSLEPQSRGLADVLGKDKDWRRTLHLGYFPSKIVFATPPGRDMASHILISR
jgi:hypothetical protein